MKILSLLFTALIICFCSYGQDVQIGALRINTWTTTTEGVISNIVYNIAQSVVGNDTNLAANVVTNLDIRPTTLYKLVNGGSTGMNITNTTSFGNFSNNGTMSFPDPAGDKWQLTPDIAMLTLTNSNGGIFQFDSAGNFMASQSVGGSQIDVVSAFGGFVADAFGNVGFTGIATGNGAGLTNIPLTGFVFDPTNVFVLKTNGIASSIILKSNATLWPFPWISPTTNVIGIHGAGIISALGTYVTNILSSTWSNILGNGSDIIFQNPTYFLRTNGVSLYSTSNLLYNSTWLDVIGSTAVPTNSGFGYNESHGGIRDFHVWAQGLEGIVPMASLDTSKVITNNSSPNFNTATSTASISTTFSGANFDGGNINGSSGNLTNFNLYSSSGIKLLNFYLTNGIQAGELAVVSGKPKWIFNDGGFGLTVSDTNANTIGYFSAANIPASAPIGSLSVSNMYALNYVGNGIGLTNVTVTATNISYVALTNSAAVVTNDSRTLNLNNVNNQFTGAFVGTGSNLMVLNQVTNPTTASVKSSPSGAQTPINANIVSVMTGDGSTDFIAGYFSAFGDADIGAAEALRIHASGQGAYGINLDTEIGSYGIKISGNYSLDGLTILEGNTTNSYCINTTGNNLFNGTNTGKYWKGDAGGLTNLSPASIKFNTNPHIPTAVTLTGSVFTFSNATPSVLECYFSGSVAYSVSKNGVGVFGSLAADGYFLLQPTNQCAITYTVAPTLFTNAMF